MGAKYRPTIKDLNADKRFQKQALTTSKFIKPAAVKRPLPGAPPIGGKTPETKAS